MQFRTDDGQQRYDTLAAHAPDVVVGLDFDGTLSPIVERPEQAVIHPDAPAALARLATKVSAVVVITGRPARQVVELGGLEAVADDLPEGTHLAVMGQYGNERWDSATREFTSPEPPHALQDFRAELPRLLAAQDAADAHVEEKGLAVAVHTRQLPDAQAALGRLETVLAEAADRHGLQLQPGRMVLEVREPGMHKGVAVREAMEIHHGRGILFVGDDLGDIEAFEAVEELGQEGVVAPLRVCADPRPGSRLHAIADLVVDGPGGVLELLRRLTTDAAALRA
jgi:trehalose 6-phosphate phosphatase